MLGSTTELPKEHIYQHHKSQSFNFHTKKSALLQKSLDEHKASTSAACTVFMAPPIVTKQNQQRDYNVSPISIHESIGLVDVVQKKSGCYVPLQVTIPTCCLRSQLNEMHKRKRHIANFISQPYVTDALPLATNEINNFAQKFLPTAAIEVIATTRIS